MPCPRPFAQWDCRWHGIAPRRVHEGPVGMWRFDMFWRFLFCEHHRATNIDKSRWQKWLRVACCVFDSRPAETFVKFSPAKPGVVWSILSLENFNFCNAGDCQCFVFMHLLHPNPTPNSICLEPSCHVNQTSSPCHWTCRHRCGQFHSRRPGWGNILAQFFEIVSGADGEWSPEGAKQIKL